MKKKKREGKCFQKWEEEEGNKVWGHHALHCRVWGGQLPPPPHQGTKARPGRLTASVTAAFFDACLRRCRYAKSPCVFGRNPREVLVLVSAPERSCAYLSSGLFRHPRPAKIRSVAGGKAMKGKGGAMDRRSSARWRVLVLCAFCFGLGMLFTDRWVSPSPSLYYYLFLPESFGSRRALRLRLGFLGVPQLELLGGCALKRLILVAHVASQI